MSPVQPNCFALVLSADKQDYGFKLIQDDSQQNHPSMQPATRRLLTAGAVLGAGIVLALPFRLTPAQSGLVNQNSEVKSESGGTKVPLQIPSQDEDQPRAATPEPASSKALKLTNHQESKDSQGSAIPRPAMTQQLPAAGETVPPARSITRATVNTPPTAPATASDEQEFRTHWITDGDTLEHLARRFLGDASRWREIRDLNREILPAEDILPIGKQLRIPPKDLPAAAAQGSSVPTMEGLVPIRWENAATKQEPSTGSASESP